MQNTFDNYNDFYYEDIFFQPYYYYTPYIDMKYRDSPYLDDNEYSNCKMDLYDYYTPWLDIICNNNNYRPFPNIKLPKISLPKTQQLPKISLPKTQQLPKISLPKPQQLPKISLPKPDQLPKVSLPDISKIDIDIEGIPTVPNAKQVMKQWEQKSKQYGGEFIDEASEAWEQAKEEAKNARDTLDRIKRRFIPCVPAPGYSCVEVNLIDSLPIFGSQKSQDIVLRICYPPTVKIQSEIKKIVLSTVKECSIVAMKKAEKVFYAAVVLSTFGALVGTLPGALTKAIETFANAFLDCMTSGVSIDGERIIKPSIYMRNHTYFPPTDGPCKSMYDNQI